MRILCITDLHNALLNLEAILDREEDGDVIVLGGDLTHFGTPEQAEKIVDRAAATGLPVIAVAGNCDSARIDEWLDERGVGLHAHGRRIEDVGFFGLSAMPPWTGRMYEFTEGELDAFLERGHREVSDARPLVLVTHSPPRGAVDLISRGQHVGSTAVRKWVEHAEPDLVICGHIHEARGIERMGRSLVVNCGKALAGEYAVAELTPEATAELRRID